MTAPSPSTVIASLALLVSVGLLIVHWRNQVERRHAEILQARAQIISQLSAMQQHLSSQLMHGETVRLELRRLPDRPEKYGWIERIPPILDTMKKMRTEVR